MKPKCPSCQRHKLAIKALQQQMLAEVNSLRKLLQMPPFESVYSSFLSSPVTTAASSSIDAVPSEPDIPATPMLESMPPEILNQIASFVSSNDIIQLCHAVPYYKYISKAMYNVACAYSKKNTSKPAQLWPHIDVRREDKRLTSPLTHHLLGGYSRILSRHGGSAGIDESHGTEGILRVLPERIVMSLNRPRHLHHTEEFFAAVFTAKKTIVQLSFGDEYFKPEKPDPASLKLATKWLLKLPIYELRFLSYSADPTAIIGMLHLVPMLGSLHLRHLKDCAGVALSECKSLRHLTLTRLFEGEESPQSLVQQLVDVLKGTKIQQVRVTVPDYWQNYMRRDLANLVAALFLEHGWHGQLECHESWDMPMNLVCRRRE
ncbi:hypothetical protein HDU80_009385 [Chytriomyces hyalinus]|nr:hypothetical protein HDU80_009385 [Chytriomyces hyalinus]